MGRDNTRGKNTQVYALKHDCTFDVDTPAYAEKESHSCTKKGKKIVSPFLLPRFAAPFCRPILSPRFFRCPTRGHLKQT
ncbi:hypothetical protein POVWA2_027520 [Plasmodium ovale wallikeri]|uniref:Uncharacterized protein n=1 Tax=Plasmodium ovale wallikeri TaxID=864142 RepID=A0A1A8YWJ3_PLAOA|nr:hypothetical protein POVWA1_027350 [Plasmodium ovale wallikeri]SBT35937.1 hypothetical protein POVWA2_027520 [Plasmodium ovale wallikeri]